MSDAPKQRGRRLRYTIAAAAVLLGTVAVQPGAVRAQAGAVSREVVQQLPSREALQLQTALSKLARDPRDVGALVAAGDAARAMGDVEASVGFYRRASQIDSANANVKAGLAAALVLDGDPFTAIPLFDEAEKAGADARKIAAERGLAYDLVGNSTRAQQYYRQALARGDDAEVRRRLALSQSILGDDKAAEETLMPLLRKQDKSAWRTRAFGLAIVGKTKDAVRITDTMLPPKLAERIAPYMRYMPQLTPAQQAAAANLGRFPRAAEIGRDDPRVAAFGGQAASAARQVAAVDTPLVPQGEPLGSKDTRTARSTAPAETASARRTRERTEQAARNTQAARNAQAAAPRVAPPDPMPTREVAEAAVTPEPTRDTRQTSVELPAVADAGATSTKAPTVAPVATSVATQAPSPRSQTATRAPTPAPAALASSTPSPSTPSPSTAVPSASLSGSSTALATPNASASQPRQTPSPALARVELPPVASSPATARSPAAAAVSPVTTAAAVPEPGFDLATVPGRGTVPTASAADILDASTAGATLGATPAAPSAQPEQTFSAIFGDLGQAVPRAVPVSGAVDVSKIEPAAPKPAPEPEAKAQKEAKPKEKPKPAPPSHPSRIWVQLGIGQSLPALRIDWKKLAKQAAPLKGKASYVSDMGRTNRMLTGPFESQKAANQFIADLKKAGLDGPYIWTSPAGQVVDLLSE